MKRLAWLLPLLLPALLLAFPTAVVIDTFDRADVNPMATNWTTPVLATDAAFRIVSNVAAATTVTGVHSNSYWNLATYGPDTEVFVTISTKVVDDNAMYLFARLKDFGASTVDGYFLYVIAPAAAGTDTFQIFRLDNGAGTQLGASVNLEVATGDSFGFSAVGSTLKGWHKPAAGSWTEILSRTDATYGAAGNVGIGMTTNTSSTGRFNDFGAGTLSSGNPSFYYRMMSQQ